MELVLLSIISLSIIFLFVYRKYWIVFCIYPICDMWIPYLRINNIPVRVMVFLLIVSAFVLYKVGGEKIKLPPKAIRDNVIIVFAFLILTFLVHTFFFIMGEDVRFGGRVIRVAMGILISLIIYNLFYTERKLKIFIYTFIIICAISSTFALLQYSQVQWAYDVQWFLQSTTPIFDTQEHKAALYRPGGLALYCILFSYHITAVFPLCLTLFLFSKSRFQKYFLGIISVIFFLSAFATLTRSAVLGIFIGSFYVLGVQKNLKNLILCGLFLFFSVLFVLPRMTQKYELGTKMVDRFSSYSVFTSGVHNRYTIIVGNLILGSLYPLGTGGLGQKFIAENSSYFSHLDDWRDLLRITSHNQFINMLVFYGFPGLLLLILFYRNIFRNLAIVNKNTNNHFLRVLVLGLKGSFISYIINSLFHNGGPLGGELVSWHYLGMYFACIGLYLKSKHLEKDGEKREGIKLPKEKN